MALAKKRLGNYLSGLTQNGEGVRRFEVEMGLPGTVQDLFLKSSSISTNTSTNTSGGTSWNPKKDP